MSTLNVKAVEFVPKTKTLNDEQTFSCEEEAEIQKHMDEFLDKLDLEDEDEPFDGEIIRLYDEWLLEIESPSEPVKGGGVASTPEHTTQSSKTVKICKFWPNCRFGKKCRFHHPPS